MKQEFCKKHQVDYTGTFCGACAYNNEKRKLDYLGKAKRALMKIEKQGYFSRATSRKDLLILLDENTELATRTLKAIRKEKINGI